MNLLDPIAAFHRECEQRIAQNQKNIALKHSAHQFMLNSIPAKYSYNFSWCGRPIIQYPQDIVAMQEIIWQLKPGLIIETGVAHGGSLIFYASLMEMIGDMGIVVGIDNALRDHNRNAILHHPLSKRITLIDGSSVDPNVIQAVKALVDERESVLVCLDSNHTQEHVFKELEAYAPFISLNSYLVVFDTIVEFLPNDYFDNRPWGKLNNPHSAVLKFLDIHPEFEIDHAIQQKLLVTASPDGYLKRVS